MPLWRVHWLFEACLMSMTETAITRLSLFAIALALMLFWEWLRPFHRGGERKISRVTRHLALMTLNFGVLRMLSGGGAFGVAWFAAERGWGLFPAIGLSPWAAAVLSLLLLDAAIYAQHVVFHKVPLLWRLHKVHHSDLEFDTSTAIRFHPFELVLSMFFKMALVAAFGIAPAVVLTFEALLNACAQFNHGNVRLSPRTERAVRQLLITPDLHRIHHSRRRCETDSNFGFSVPWWDWLFGTYLATPDSGQEGLQIGLDELRDPMRLRFIDLLKVPFQSNPKSPPT